MNLFRSKTFGFTFVLILILVSALLYPKLEGWIGSSKERDHLTLETIQSSPKKSIDQKSVDRQEPKDPRLRFLDRFPEQPKYEDFEKFLEGSGRSTGSLAAVYLLTADRRVAEELATRPNEKLAIFSLLYLENADGNKRLSLSQAAIQLDPENPLGYLMGAEGAFSTGQPELANELLREGLSKKSFNTFTTEFSLETRAAWKSLGYNALEAKLISRQYGNSEIYVTKPIREIARRIWAAGIQDGTEQSKIDAATKIMPLVDLLKNAPGRESSWWSGQTTELETKVLRQLPQDVLYGDSGETVKEKSDSVIAKFNEDNDLVQASLAKLKTVDPADVEEYFAREERLGQVAAAQWLLSKQ